MHNPLNPNAAPIARTPARRLSTASAIAIGLLLISLLSGCLTIRTEHKVEPIHVTVDVNLKLQRELDDFFSDLDRTSATRIYKELTNDE